MSKQTAVIVTGVFVVLLLFFFTFGGRRSARLPEVKLVLFVTADQFADAYIDRFQGVLDGGLKKLIESGVVFRKVRHPHANTATCPGHASIATGTFPAKHGIVGNWWYDAANQKERYCVEGQRFDRSPYLLRRDALPDWIQDDYSKSRVFSVSGKDRAAIIMGGKEPDAAFWYDRDTGKIRSSRYYFVREYPWWLDTFNDNHSADSYFGKLWQPVEKSPEAYLQTQSSDFDFGDFPDLFPHALGSAETAPDKSFYGDLYRSPFADQLVLDFSLELLTQYKLGRGDDLDYLSVSLSALDTVGHRFGPNSREVHDVIRRLDRSLGEFFNEIDKQVGLEHTLIVFTSDHGIAEFPEYRTKHNLAGERVKADDIACIQSAFWFQQGEEDIPVFEAPLYVRSALKPSGGEVPKYISEHVKKTLQTCGPVESVFTAEEVEEYSAREGDDSVLASLKRNHYPGRSADFYLVGKPYFSFSAHRGINHGSPHDYDAEVPLIFFHPKLGKSKKKLRRKERVTDIAPTVAALVGVSQPRDLDGVELPLEIAD